MTKKFMLSEELQEFDSMGPGYVYEMREHPTAEDLVTVHFEEDGEWVSTNYPKEEAEQKFDAGDWILVDRRTNHDKTL